MTSAKTKAGSSPVPLDPPVGLPEWDDDGMPQNLLAAAEDADEWLALIERLHGMRRWKFSEPDSLEKLRACRAELRRFMTPNAGIRTDRRVNMGRELKRVPLDFAWPENKVWEGFVNPHYAKSHNCTACGGSGDTTARQRLSDLVSLLMLSGTDALRGACHPYLCEAPLYSTQGKTCDADMAALTAGLAGRTPSFMGHDACDKWSATKKIIAAAGLPEEWGTCQECNGDGTIWDSPEAKQAADAWTRSEPPTGDGYQVWETVSEGSPISPVFATPEELAQHMAGTRWGADKGSSVETWLKFINGPGWAVSMVMDANGIRSGADAAF